MLTNTGQSAQKRMENTSDFWYNAPQTDCDFVGVSKNLKCHYFLARYLMSGYSYFNYDQMTIAKNLIPFTDFNTLMSKVGIQCRSGNRQVFTDLRG